MKIKKKYFYTFLLGLLLVASGIYLAYSKQNTKEVSESTETTPTPVHASPQEILPIKADHKNVANATVFYTFTGQIASLNATTISLKSDDTPLPTFTILDTTDYTQLVNGQPETVDKSLITSTSTVNLVASYNYETKLWTLNRILLIPPAPPPAQ
jgi:hypothetical protein